MIIKYRKSFNDYVASEKINKVSGKIVSVAGQTRSSAINRLIKNYK